MSQLRTSGQTFHGFRRSALRVLVVVALASGVGAVASAPAGALAGVVTATPSTGLVDGQTITVGGSGWVPGHSILVIECQIDALTFCDFGAAPVTADTSGSFSLSLVVTRQLGPVDCSATPVTSKCAALAVDLNESPQPVVAYADLSFAPLPRVLPGGAVVAEGNSGTTDLLVPLTLSSASTQTVTVQWRTGPAGPAPRADPATDFTATSGTVTFAPGETAKTVTVGVNGDTLAEPDEWIVVGFNHPTNAKIGGFYGLGFGVILNDD